MERFYLFFISTIIKLRDIEMVILGEGRERTESEFREFFNSTGFKLTNIIPTQLPLYILEGECL